MPSNPSSSTGDSAIRSSSRGWTEAESAAACVLRYVTAMRGQLIELFGDAELADQTLALLLSHLAKKGYSGLATGRLRDFLIRGIRAAAKVVVADLPEARRPDADPKTLRSDADSWASYWRQSLLEATWRALERKEHQNPDAFDFTALWSAKENPQETLETLAVRIGREKQRQISAHELEEQLRRGRKRFRQLLAREIASTLENPTPDAIRTEFADLRLSEKLP